MRGIISVKNESQLSSEKEMNAVRRYLTHNELCSTGERAQCYITPHERSSKAVYGESQILHSQTL